MVHTNTNLTLPIGLSTTNMSNFHFHPGLNIIVYFTCVNVERELLHMSIH